MIPWARHPAHHLGPRSRRGLVLRGAVWTAVVGLAAGGAEACDGPPGTVAPKGASRVISVPAPSLGGDGAPPAVDRTRALRRREGGGERSTAAPSTIGNTHPRDEEGDLDASVPPVPAHFGRAFHFVTPVRSEPGAPSGRRPLGYLRRGARFLAEANAVNAPGCEPGWRTLLTGGVVCPGRGVVVGSTPPGEPLVTPPQEPDETAPLPYVYARVLRATWELYRRPDDGEAFAALPTPTAEPTTEPTTPVASAEDGGDVASDPAGTPDHPEAPAEPRAPDPVDVALPEIVRGPLAPGWFVSIDREELTPDGVRFVRTVRGTWVAADAVTPVGGPGDDPAPGTVPGVHLVPGRTLPLAFPVASRGARLLLRAPGNGEPTSTVRVDRPIPLAPDAVANPEATWSPTADGSLLRRADVRLARHRPRPRELAADERWIHVDLGEQVLVAYEGDRPVFATLVSTGRVETPTPSGVHRIDAKHVTSTMDGDGSDPAAEAYRIDDVPWVQFFSGGYALHGAFWHDGFGRPRSHGCVNLSPADARWLFQFTAPGVPPGWHGRFREPGEASTAVVVDP